MNTDLDTVMSWLGKDGGTRIEDNQRLNNSLS